MEYKNIKGIIIKETKYKENDKILTVVTDSLGKINVMAKGVAKTTSKLSGASMLSLFEMDLKSFSDDMFIITGASKLIDFYDISKDLESYAYVSYIFNLAFDMFLPEDPFPELFKLLINTVYLYLKNTKNKELIKCIFELRALILSGYAINIDECAICGKEEINYINLYEGECYCKNCADDKMGKPVSFSVYSAIKHITYSEDKKLFSFTLSDQLIKELSIISTNYVKICMEKEYSSLKYLRTIQKGIN
ncbi:MAG: DNA repair protein RecO [Clostridia bacterium]|nr:DNA repair protein RecO [Oscillospiraceae bacterium]MBR4892949.1 DNA repair protein RecO [Clostridia bacterium]